jgi:PKD repeat protein
LNLGGDEIITWRFTFKGDKIAKLSATKFIRLKYMTRARATLIAVFLFSIANLCACRGLFAAVYYVDNKNGDDNHDGRTETSAWKTINKVNQQLFAPGDEILFKRGDTWREKLIVSSSGTTGNPITYGAYGTGDNPVINGADQVDGWLQVSGNIYRVPCDWNAGVVLEDGVPLDFLKWADSVETTFSHAGPGSFSLDHTGGLLYLSTTDGSGPLLHAIEVSKRDYCILDQGKCYLVIENLTCKNAYRHGMAFGYGRHVQVNNVSVSFCGGTKEGSECLGNGIEIGADSDDITLKDVKSFANFDVGISIQNSGAPNSNITNISLDGCLTFRNRVAGIEILLLDNCNGSRLDAISIKNSVIRDQDGEGWSGSKGCFGISLEALSGSIDRVTISTSEIYGNSIGIVVLPKNTGHLTLKRNKIFGNTKNGIKAYDFANPSTTTIQAEYNLIYQNGSDGLLFDVQNGPAFSLCNNVFYDNGKDLDSCYNCFLKAFSVDGAHRVINNIFFAAGSVAFYDQQGLNSPSAVDTNLYYRAAGVVIHFKGNDYGQSEFGGYQAAAAHDLHSLQADPLLIDPAGADFRLRPFSPCIDSGTDVDLKEDFMGNAVPHGSRVDVGALEYQGTTTNELHVSISALPTSGPAPLAVSFAADAVGGSQPYSYAWDFGDGKASQEQNPLHTYANPGIYSVAVTVEDENNLKGSASTSIRVTGGSGFNLSLAALTGAPAIGSGGTTDPKPGNYSLLPGSTLLIKSNAVVDYRFSKWTGDINASEAIKEVARVTMDNNKQLSAYFCTKCGDVNGDLKITPADAQVAFDIFLGRIANPTECQKENADVNGDGTIDQPKISPGDAQAIFDKYLGKAALPGDCSCQSRTGAASSSLNPAKDIQLVAESLHDDQGRFVIVTAVSNSTLNTRSFGFDLAFPAALLEFVGVQRNAAARNGSVVDANVMARGVLRAGGFGLSPDSTASPQALITLVFRARRSTGESYSFEIVDFGPKGTRSDSSTQPPKSYRR